TLSDGLDQPPGVPPIIIDDPLPVDITLPVVGNQWHLSSGRGSDGGHSAGTSFYFGSGEGPGGGGSYANNARGTLVSPLIALTGVSGPVALEFSQFLQAEAGFDFATVGVLAGGVETILASNNPSVGGLPNATNGFQAVTLDLSAFAGQQIRVFFR